MMTRIVLKNFKSFPDADVKLEPLTIVVGPNASGKTSFLSALRPLRPSLFSNADMLSLDESWMGRSHDECFIHQYFSNEGEGFLGRASGKRKGGASSFTLQSLHLDLKELRLSRQIEKATSLTPDGSNLVNVFATLSRKEQVAVATQLCELVPVFQDVDFEPIEGSGGEVTLRFQDRWNDSLWYLPARVSDGTMLLLAFLTLQYQNPPVDLVTIEEPERGLHPYLLGQLISFLRRLSRGEIGKKAIQVVLATHSAELLDHARPEEVRFLRRDSKTGGTVVESAPTNTPDWAQVYRTYNESMGSIWLSGSVGGVPGE